MKKFLVCLILMIVALGSARGQTHTFPALDTVNVFTAQNSFPQINNTLYAGSTVYANTQAAVSAGCGMSGNIAVEIPAGRDSGTVVTSLTGCSTVFISDKRGASPVNYQYISGAYVSVSTLTASQIAAAGTLSNNTTGNAAISTTTSGVGSSLYQAPVYDFGDSRTGCVGASTQRTCYVGILQASHGGPFYTEARGGSGSEWISTQVASVLNLTADLSRPLPVSIISTGINNASGCGVTSGCQATFVNALNASVALAGMTSAQGSRIAGGSMSCTGSWTTDSSTYQYPSVVSTTSGDICSFSITTTGNPVGLEYIADVGSGGISSCILDSGSPATLVFAPPAAVAGNLTEAIYRQEFIASAGTHTVTCTNTSSTNVANTVKYLAADTVPVGQTASLPFVILTNVQGEGGTNDSDSLIMSNLALGVESAFASEGLNIVPADVRTPTTNPIYYNPGQPGYPTNPVTSSGGLHFNDGGHALTASAIITASKRAFVPTVGNPVGPYQSYGLNPVDATTYMGWNQGATFANNSINPGSIYIYPGQGFELGSFGTFHIPAAQTFDPIMRLNTGFAFCFTSENSQSPAYTTQVQWHTYSECTAPWGHYMYSLDGGGAVHNKIFHPWGISWDNIDATGDFNESIDQNSSFVEVPTLTTSRTYSLPGCNSSLTGTPIYNKGIWIQRVGNDGFPIVFSVGLGDTFNGGGTTQTWTAFPGDSILATCNANAVTGGNWQLSPSTNNAGSLIGTLKTAQLPSGVVVQLTGTTGSIGGSAITAGTCVSGTATVTGAVVGHTVGVATVSGDLPNALEVLSAAVTSTNTVTVQRCAIALVTPSAELYHVTTY